MVKFTFFIDNNHIGVPKLTGHFVPESFGFTDEDWYDMSEEEQVDWLSEKADWYLNSHISYGVDVSD